MEYIIDSDIILKGISTDTCEIAIPANIIDEWQSIVDLIVRLSGALAGLIMRMQDENIEIFVSSNNPDNPYSVGTSKRLKNSGLYCERVINDQKMLMVCNALKSEEWANNPDIEKNMICYLGFPIIKPDGQPFGTICILDNKENSFSTNLLDLMEKMRDLIESHLKLLHLSYHDQLTGLYNRTYFATKVVEEMKQAEINQHPISLLMLDLDNFKRINDSYGHLIGDEILKRVAQAASRKVRKTDYLVRFGGEEFIVLMPKTSIVQGIEVAEDIRKEIESLSHPIAGGLTVSIGVAERIHSESFDRWCKRADEALYLAKATGRNRVVASEEQETLSIASICIYWKEEWECGHREIDAQHKQLIEIANRLINMSFSGINHEEIMRQLDALLTHISHHFHSEEKILENIGYPKYAEHAKLHANLIDNALTLKQLYKRGEKKSSAFFSFVLDDVLIDHLIKADAKFFPYIKGIKT
ncbi:MAG: bacteriohemerythrin [Clostridiales bacterium]|nr:bacteriohemerythrin [Clostridiales bacterium]